MLGNAKSVLTIALAVVLLGVHLSPSCVVGYVASIASGLAYTVVVVRERSAPLQGSEPQGSPAASGKPSGRNGLTPVGTPASSPIPDSGVADQKARARSSNRV